MKCYKLSNKGAALVTVIMVMLVVMSMVGVVLTLVTSQSKSEENYEKDAKALHVAEAGLNQYLWDLNDDSAITVALDTVLIYPEYNPTSAYKLNLIESSANKKVILATGWLLSDSSIKRTVEVTFTKRTFTQYVYFSDNDPDDIWWGSSDNCYGPYHTNTNLLVRGTPKFWSNVSYVGSIDYYTSAAVDHPVFKVAPVKLDNAIVYPSNNSTLMNYAVSGGYYYEGRTSIRLNADGTITVWNPNRTPSLETRNLPANGVIYVNEKAGASANKFDSDNGNVFISGILDGRLTVAAKNDIYITGYDPTVNNLTSSTATNGIQYKDTAFNLDTASGVVMVNEIAGDTETDLLGLIADRYVAVLTRGWFNDSDANSARSNFVIHGALFAINGSFINSYQIDHSGSSYPNPAGTLTVRGAIIQKKRGAVGVGNESGATSGYSKNYAHDPRMMYDQPPYFLEPEESGWEIRDWKEIN